MAERYDEFGEELPDVEELTIPSAEHGDFVCRKDNTFIVLYEEEEYEDKNHIIYIQEDGRPRYIYSCQRMMDILFEAGWEYISVNYEPHISVYKQVGELATEATLPMPRDFTELPAASNKDLWELYNITPEDFRD